MNDDDVCSSLLCVWVGDDQLYYYAYSIVADTNFNKKKKEMRGVIKMLMLVVALY